MCVRSQGLSGFPHRMTKTDGIVGHGLDYGWGIMRCCSLDPLVQVHQPQSRFVHCPGASALHIGGGLAASSACSPARSTDDAECRKCGDALHSQGSTKSAGHSCLTLPQKMVAGGLKVVGRAVASRLAGICRSVFVVSPGVLAVGSPGSVGSSADVGAVPLEA